LRLDPRGRLYLLAVVAPALGSAQGLSSQPVDGRCTRLKSLSQPGLTILSATTTPAGEFAAGDGKGFAVPASCRVVAVAQPTADSRIGIEVWLPDSWNGRYAQLGNGGFAGNIDHPSLANEIRRGNAAAMTDTGHKANQFDASWALGHPQKIVDYGYRSIKVTSNAAKALIQQYYDRPIRRRYYIGCSNGGRQALIAAQRFPNDWDGIIAGSAAVQWTKQLAAFAAIQHRLRSSPENWIPAAKLPLVQRAAIAACVSQTAIRSCRLDVWRLTCAKSNATSCLTPAEAASLDLIQSGPKGSRGGQLFAGFDPISVALPVNWETWILNPDRNAPSQLAFATQAYRNMILDRPDWRIEEWIAERDFALASTRQVAGRPLSAILDADNPDLGAFARHGGKLIMYVGGLDAAIAPGAAVDYYRRVAQHFGGFAPAQRFARMFVVPGMQHCQGGLGPNAFGQALVAPALRSDSSHDLREALEDWVERGKVPSSIVAAKYPDDDPRRAAVATRRIWPFPRAPAPITH